MKRITKIFAIGTMFILLTSCGYESYNDCVKEEIKLNSGKKNQYIENYCAEQHPESRPTYETRYYKLTPSETDVSWDASKRIYTIKNFSDYDIDILKIVFTKRKNCEKSFFDKEINWSEHKNYLPGSSHIRPGKTKTISLGDTSSFYCVHTYAVHKY